MTTDHYNLLHMMLRIDRRLPKRLHGFYFTWTKGLNPIRAIQHNQPDMLDINHNQCGQIWAIFER